MPVLRVITAPSTFIWSYDSELKKRGSVDPAVREYEDCSPLTELFNPRSKKCVALLAPVGVGHAGIGDRPSR